MNLMPCSMDLESVIGGHSRSRQRLNTSRAKMGMKKREATPYPRCECVNAVDKGVSRKFGVKAVDKGLSRASEVLYGRLYHMVTSGKLLFCAVADLERKDSTLR